MGMKLKNNWLFLGTISAQEVYVSLPILLGHKPRFSIPHMYLPVTLFSKGMLALDDDDSGFLLGSWCEGARTAQGFPISEKDQQGHHNAACPRDGAHGCASCDHIIC